MKKTLFAMLSMAVLFCGIGFAQEIVLPVTSFEDYEGAYSGDSIMASFVLEMPDTVLDVPALDGDAALLVEYDHQGNQWPWIVFSIPGGSIDATGMRELHMWVYFTEDTVGTPSLQVELQGGINLGDQTAPSLGEWHELVWTIDRVASDNRISSLGDWGGRFDSGNGEARGTCYIDNVFFVRPDGIPELEEITVYGFNDNDDMSSGWNATWDGIDTILGLGDTEPSEGDNYLEMGLVPGWKAYAQTSDMRSQFDRWPDVVEVLVDVKVTSDYDAGWGNFVLVIQSGGPEGTEGITDWDQYPPRGFSGLTEWTTLSWDVDMSKHAAAFDPAIEGTWTHCILVVQTPDDYSGLSYMYVDNFRVAVPKESTAISDWSLF